MDENSWQYFAGDLAFFVALFSLIARSPLYFGFSMLCLFMVSSASLAGYTHAFIFGLELTWVTADHLSVIGYSVLGCLAMVGGLAIAWLPNRPGLPASSNRAVLSQTRWINPYFGWFVFGIGALAMLGESVLHRVPTLGTAVHSLSSFTTLGLLVLLAVALRNRQFGPLAAMLAIYAPITLMRAFATGHTPAKVSLLIPAVCIIAANRRITWKSVAFVSVFGFMFLTLMSGWMKTREIIRGGHLEGLSYSEKALRFLPAWFDATWDNALDIEAANDTIRDRVDMTNILAMQVRFQPRRQPYAYGGTLFDAGVAMVPRVLWPRKPAIAGGTAFVSKYTGMVRHAGDTTSIGLPYQFELYANGGPLFVVTGLFVVGYVCGRMERGLFRPETSLASLLARISITMILCDGGQRTDVVLPSLIAGAVTYFALGKFVEWSLPEFCSTLLGRPSSTVGKLSVDAQKRLVGFEKSAPRA
jgi:hypothetical protein